jgi:hypothetical protein
VELSRISAWARANKWLVAFVAVVIIGYCIGKDRALRDNQADLVQGTGGRR